MKIFTYVSIIQPMFSLQVSLFFNYHYHEDTDSFDTFADNGKTGNTQLSIIRYERNFIIRLFFEVIKSIYYNLLKLQLHFGKSLFFIFNNLHKNIKAI